MQFLDVILFGLSWVRLHEEIIDFSLFVSPTSEEEAMRCDLLERIRTLVESIWPQAEVLIDCF